MKNLFAGFILTLFAVNSYAQDDCFEAVPACTTPSFPVLEASGAGDVSDIPGPGSISNPSTNPAGVNSGCLLAGELNPTFITITVTSSGTLEFSMGDGVPTGCFDWAMWQVPAGGTFADGCAGIQGNTLPPVTCNWNGACGGYTGIASTPPTNASTGVTGSPYDFQPPLGVNPGDQFILCFSNYSGLSTTVPLSFFGSANVSCNEVHFVCPGGTTILTAPPGGSSYTWTPSAGLSATTGVSVSATPAGPTTYICNYIDGTGLSTSFSYDVLFYPTPTPNYSVAPEDCAGDDDAVVTMSPAGVGPFSYTLNGTPEPDGVFSPLAPGMYFVQVTDDNGCVGDTIVNVTAAAPCCTMTLSTTANATLCPGSCDGDATVNIVGATGTATINWLSGASPIGQTTPTATALCAGTYTAQVTDDLCTLTSSISVTSLAGPTITGVNIVQPLCFGNTNGSITVNHTGATQFSINSGPFQVSNVFSGLGAGNYTIQVQNANGCTANTTATILQPTLLVLTVDDVQNVSCNAGANGAVLITVAGGTAPYTYTWSNGMTTADITDIPAGVYNIDVADANSCFENASATVTEPTAMVLTLTIDSVSCYNYCDGGVTAAVSGGTLPYTYNWLSTTPSNTNTSTDLCVGTYDLKVTDAEGCSVTMLDFYVPQPLQVQVGIIGVKDEKCFASCDGRIVIASPDGATYSIDGGNTYVTGNIFEGLCEGIYEVFVKDENGCFNSTTAEIKRPAKVEVAFAYGPQPTDIFETEITFNNQSPNATIFTWYMDSLDILNTEDPVYAFPAYQSGTYNVCLAAQNDSGCVDSICHLVVIDDYTYAFVPNTFTPNNDGTNDFFAPVINNVTAENYQFTIFNRWGGVVFSTTDPRHIGWDGTSNGIKSKEDVYVWKITARSAFNAEKKEWNGHVNLLR